MRPRPAWTVTATCAHGWSEADVSYALAVMGEHARSVDVTASRIVWRNERNELCTHHRFATSLTTSPVLSLSNGPTWAAGSW